jgi:very-short-patch-repair endonuclease
MNATNNSPLEGWKSQSGGVFFSTKTKFTQYTELPYNPKLKAKAQKLRKAGVLSEVLFWNCVKNKKLLGLDFERQKIIGNYIVDFYCPELSFVIEIDGQSHDFKGEYDMIRESYLTSLGLEVIHYTDLEIKKNLDVVMNNLYTHFNSKKKGEKEQRWEKEHPTSLKTTTPQEGNPKNSPLEEYPPSGGGVLSSNQSPTK